MRRSCRVLSSKPIYKGKSLDLFRDIVLLPNGEKAMRELVRHPGSAAVVPLLGKGRVVLIRQFRYAARGTLWEIVCGTIEKGESPRACALREIEEEAGFRAGRIWKLADFYVSPGVSDEVITVYAADRLKKIPTRQEADEVITVKTVPLRRALQMIRKGEIRDAKSIVGLLLVAGQLKKVCHSERPKGAKNLALDPSALRASG